MRGYYTGNQYIRWIIKRKKLPMILAMKILKIVFVASIFYLAGLGIYAYNFHLNLNERLDRIEKHLELQQRYEELYDSLEMYHRDQMIRLTSGETRIDLKVIPFAVILLANSQLPEPPLYWDSLAVD